MDAITSIATNAVSTGFNLIIGIGVCFIAFLVIGAIVQLRSYNHK